MNRSTKGAIAAAAAAVLLLGGAGSLAYWTADGSVAGGDITSGHLTADSTACQGSTGWELEGDAFDTATDTLIPGDTLTKECDIVVDVEGTHFTQVDIEATTPATFGSANWDDELTVGATVSGSATGGDNVAVTQGSNNVPVVVTVTWPYGSEDNDLNGDFSTTLDDIVVTVVQDHKADAN
jgi:alternate signal-mediated exported protein